MSATAKSLDQKVIAITGASSGIGKATSNLLAGRGARLVLLARDIDRLEGLVRELIAAGGSAVAVQGDVSRSEDINKVVKTACDTYGRLDAFISNAGLMCVSAVDQLKIDEWNAMLDINVKGVTNAIAAALPVFKAQGSGHFITVASTAGLKIVPGQAVYAGTKHAVRAIMDGLRQEMVASNIRTTTITPGATRTAIFDPKPDEEQQDEARAKQMAAYYKMAMEPSAVASCIAFALEQPDEVNVGEIVVRSTAQP